MFERRAAMLTAFARALRFDAAAAACLMPRRRLSAA